MHVGAAGDQRCPRSLRPRGRSQNLRALKGTTLAILELHSVCATLRMAMAFAAITCMGGPPC